MSGVKAFCLLTILITRIVESSFFWHYLRTRQIMESSFFKRAPRFGAQILENHDRQKRSRRLARSQKLSNANLSPPTRTAFLLNEKNMARKNDRQFWFFCGYFLRKISRNIKKSPRERKSSGCPTGPSLGCPNRTKTRCGCQVATIVRGSTCKIT